MSHAQLLQVSLATLHLRAFAQFHILTPGSSFHSLIIGVATASFRLVIFMIYMDELRVRETLIWYASVFRDFVCWLSIEVRW